MFTSDKLICNFENTRRKKFNKLFYTKCLCDILLDIFQAPIQCLSTQESYLLAKPSENKNQYSIFWVTNYV